jgi:lambda repressor-like predicted transcriptional regulator
VQAGEWLMTTPCGRHRGSSAGCHDCQRIAARYDRRRRAAIAAGTWLPRASTDAVRAHVAMLRESGMSLNAIGRAAGISPKTIQELPERKYLHGPTAGAVLAVRPERELPARNMRPAIGSARRVQALGAIGWSFTEQGRQVGMHTQQVWEIAWAKSHLVTVTTADRIHDLFERLSATPGGSTRARNAAARHGWLPPLAWDDIDDPRAEPWRADIAEAEEVDEVAVARALAGQRLRLNRSEQAAALRIGLDRGEPMTRVAALLGINRFTARDLVDAGTSRSQAKRDRVEAEVLRIGSTHSDHVIAGLLDVDRGTVTRARRRLEARKQRQEQLAS